MSKIYFNIIDKIRDKEDYIEYTSKKCIKFKDLFTLIWYLYPNYAGENITLLFLQNERRKIIRDLNLYIRDFDTIEIVISYASYLLCDVHGYSIEQNENINDLYSVYIHHNITYEVFIVKIENDKLYLIDVLDSGIHRYNECVNRLISRYNF